MLDIAFIRKNPELVKKAATDKRMAVDVDALLALDVRLRALAVRVDALRSERNTLSKGMAGSADREGLASRVREIKRELAALESEHSSAQIDLDALMLTVPSIPAPEVPIGAGEEDNVEVRRVGEVRQFDFEPKDHVELCEALDLLDMPRASRIAGSRSYYLKNEAVLLEMALCRFVLDTLVSRGFTPMTVPLMVREGAMQGTGYFPIGREQAYNLPEDELFLIGTSEVSLVSYHQGEILDERELPIRYAGLSQCFRREAGTYGRDTRGLYRVHQFTKVEQVVICRADDAEARSLHEEILGNTEYILQALGLPYRVALACTGEIGIGQVRKHEVECWMPGRGAYCETHSCSTLGDFQARRLGIRYRSADGALGYAYTLNNTGIASPRILIPLLENYQNEDGSVTLPDVLRPYMGGMEEICAKHRGGN